MDNSSTLVVEDVQTYFFTKLGIVKAVDGVTFSVNRSEILGLVGESGCGKTVTGFSILGLVDPPGRVVSGRILFKGNDIVGLPEQEMHQFRGKRIAMIFQDPMMTLNPVLRIDTQMIEAITAHVKISREDALNRCRDALVRIGISSPDERLKAYPHQFSGGMRQRVSIAIALLHKPDLIIADEPTTALDVTIQAEITDLLLELCESEKMGLILITHDLGVVSQVTEKIVVMYAGKIVESGSTRAVVEDPKHPYTQGLIKALPGIIPPGSRLNQIPGMMPNLTEIPPGCAFHPRCTISDSICSTEVPALISKDQLDRMTACHMIK